MREKTFYGTLCLIQVNVRGDNFAIDPLLDEIDLKPFIKILKSRWITKILHSSRQDLEIIFQEFKIVPKSIFDTQLMANFLGDNFNISYASLAKDLLGVDLSKEQQRSNWQRRPLTQEQLEYALNDVRYLPEIYEILKQQLISENKIKYFLQEMKSVLKKKEFYNIEKQDLFKKFSMENKNQIYRNNLETLVLWRDKLAKERNIPRSFILNDSLLNEIAKENPRNTGDLRNILASQNIQNSKFVNRVLELLKNQKIRKLKKIKYVDNRLSEAQKKIYKKSQGLLRDAANHNSIRSELIINQTDLKSIILKKVRLKKTLFGWRYKVFGKFLKKLLKCR